MLPREQPWAASKMSLNRRLDGPDGEVGLGYLVTSAFFTTLFLTSIRGATRKTREGNWTI